MISFRSIFGWFEAETIDRAPDRDLLKSRAGQRLAEAVAENDLDIARARKFRKIIRAARKERRKYATKAQA